MCFVCGKIKVFVYLMELNIVVLGKSPESSTMFTMFQRTNDGCLVDSRCDKQRHLRSLYKEVKL